MRTPSTHLKPPLTAGRALCPTPRFLRQMRSAVTNRSPWPATVLLQTGAPPFPPENPRNLRCESKWPYPEVQITAAELERGVTRCASPRAPALGTAAGLQPGPLERGVSFALSRVATWEPALVTLLQEPTANPNPKPGCSPLPIWPCMREAGGRPVLMASLRLPWECRPWLAPLWDSAPGPRFMFWVGGCGQQEVMGRRVSSDNDHQPAAAAGTCPADFPHNGRTCPFSLPVGDLGYAG